MCIEKFRYCDFCNRLYKIGRSAIEPDKINIIVQEKLCGSSRCQRFNIFFHWFARPPLAGLGEGSCGSTSCTTDTCRVERVNQRCEAHGSESHIQYILETI